MSSKKYLKTVYIEWIDSQTEIGWNEFTEPDVDLCHTIGILVAETDNFIVVAHSLDSGSGEWNGLISIPHQAVKKCRTLCQIQMKSKS